MLPWRGMLSIGLRDHLKITFRTFQKKRDEPTLGIWNSPLAREHGLDARWLSEILLETYPRRRPIVYDHSRKKIGSCLSNIEPPWEDVLKATF